MRRPLVALEAKAFAPGHEGHVEVGEHAAGEKSQAGEFLLLRGERDKTNAADECVVHDVHSVFHVLVPQESMP